MVAATKAIEVAATTLEPAKTHFTLLRVNLTWVFAGNATYLACQWLVLAVLAKFGSTEAVGQLAMGFAITAPIFLLSNLRLRTVQASDAKREYGAADYLAVRVLMTILALAATGCLCLISRMSGNVAAVVMFVGLAKAFESGSDLFYGLFQQNDHTSRMTVSIFMRGICSVAAVAVVSYFRKDAVWAAGALCVSSGALLVACDLPLTSQMLRRLGMSGPRLRWDWTTICRLTRRHFPLGLAAMLMSLGANMPRYFIERSLGIREVGIFSAVWYLASAGGYIVSALAEGASPRLGRLYAIGDAEMIRKLLYLMAGIAVFVGLGTLAVGALSGRRILSLIYNSGYQSAQGLLIWLSVAAIAANLASVLSYALVSVRKYEDQLISLVLMTAVTAVACYVLVPIFGRNGAAAGLIVGYLTQAAWGMAAVARLRSAV